MTRRRRLMIDLDGVLHQYSKGYHDGTIYDPPVEGAPDAVNKLVAAGYTYVVFTTRMSETPDPQRQAREIRRWLSAHGFPEPEDVTSRKMPAIAYIDDRGIRFTNWRDIMQLWT